MKKILAVILIIVTFMAAVPAIAGKEVEASAPLPVKVLILPKFELGDMTGDFPGEAQYYFEQYLIGAEEYDIPYSNYKLYYKDEIALCLLGMGKVNAALSTMSILSDSRFDFSRAYVISTGCAGSSVGNTVMGDVIVVSSAVDYDLGHHADAREISDPDGTTWFHDNSFDDFAVVHLDHDLIEKVYSMVKDVPVETTEVTRNYMRKAFDGADWAVRDPQVLRGTTVTGDNYWKGKYGHENALLMTETYKCPDPYALTEMEDVAVARTMDRMGMLDQLIIIRDSVNIDVFMLGSTPETLWANAEAMHLADEDNVESADIFETAMKNNFEAGRIIIDSILAGEF